MNRLALRVLAARTSIAGNSFLVRFERRPRDFGVLLLCFGLLPLRLLLRERLLPPSMVLNGMSVVVLVVGPRPKTAGPALTAVCSGRGDSTELGLLPMVEAAERRPFASALPGAWASAVLSPLADVTDCCDGEGPSRSLRCLLVWARSFLRSSRRLAAAWSLRYRKALPRTRLLEYLVCVRVEALVALPRSARCHAHIQHETFH